MMLVKDTATPAWINWTASWSLAPAVTTIRRLRPAALAPAMKSIARSGPRSMSSNTIWALFYGAQRVLRLTDSGLPGDEIPFFFDDRARPSRNMA